ncbi:MAG: hypothetical protein CL674_11330, partial [Bdellovibrionaceae bacterium]|nr:hypothetical protein [Pseudobdellovibrionaceae bacterium]
GAAKAATGIAPLKKYISQKAGSFKDQNRGVNPKNKKKSQFPIKNWLLPTRLSKGLRHLK